jgi:hypothetical protein
MIRITETLSTEAGDFDATVEIERRHMLHGDGWYARLETATHVYHVSRYDDEDAWIIDGLWLRANSFPIYHNGDGSRCTRLSVITQESAIDALDRAARLERARRAAELADTAAATSRAIR